MSRSDPVRSKYFAPLEWAERASDALFYTAAALSVVALVIEKDPHSLLYNIVMIAFAVSVAAFFFVGMATRLYFGPRATDQRTRDFVSSVYDVKLTHELTDGYYNNELQDPVKRLAAQVLENTHFSKAIALRMAKVERTKVTCYVLIWLVALLARDVGFDLVLVASQAIFSEQILSKWMRIEWLRSRCESIYTDVYKLFQSRTSGSIFNAGALEAFAIYESVKANAAVTLSRKIFDRKNVQLSSEWDKIKSALKIMNSPENSGDS